MSTTTNHGGGARYGAPRPAEPEALRVNHTAPNTVEPWNVTAAAATRDGVRVDVARRTLTAPTGRTAEARALRGFATVRAALDPESMPALVEAIRQGTTLGSVAYHLAAEIVEAANVWRVAHHTRRHSIADLDAIASPDLPHRATARLMAGDHLGALVEYATAQATGESRRVAHALGGASPQMKATLSKLRARVTNILRRDDRRWWDSHTRDTVIISPNGDETKCSTSAYMTTTEIVRAMLDAAAPRPEERHANAPHSETREVTAGSTLWHPVILWRGALDRPNAGTLTRRNRRASHEGRTFRFPDRLWTDPERRAFQRKARGNGATLVFDCSGSMGLDLDDIRHVLDAAGGATIYAYQHRAHHAANLYVLAHDGHAVAQMPPTLRPGAGSNGIDAPALRFAAEHHNPRDPFVWITDGHYNGNSRSTGDVYLATDLLDILRDISAIVVETPDAAVAMLERMARGGHPDSPSMPWSVTEYANPTHLEPRAPWLPPRTKIGANR